MIVRESRLFALLAVALAAVALSGCTSADLVAQKDKEISEIRYEADRLRGSLAAAVSDARELKKSLEASESETKNAKDEVAGLTAKLTAANEQLELASEERSRQTVAVADADARVESLERTLAKVRSVASDSVGELADLRLKVQSSDQELAKLRDEAKTLREDRAKLLDKVDRTQAELTKSKAVLRSLRSGQSDEETRVAELAGRVADLEHENADLRGERVALEKRVEVLDERDEKLSVALAKLQKAQETGEREIAVVEEAPAVEQLYVSDPTGLWKEIVAFSQNRYQVARAGNMAWDTFDKIAVGFAGVFALFFLWSCLRSLQIRRLKRETADLREELREVDEKDSVRTPRATTPLSAPAPRQESPPSPRAPRLPRRGGGFSAVISNKSVQPDATVPAPAPATAPSAQLDVDEEGEFEDAPTMLVGASMPATTPAASAPSTAPSAGRQWEAEEEFEESGDDLASTQIISNVSREDLEAEGLTMPGASAAPAGERDLLDELKSVISEKYGSEK